jgi:hypothetical protein
MEAKTPVRDHVGISQCRTFLKFSFDTVLTFARLNSDYFILLLRVL